MTRFRAADRWLVKNLPQIYMTMIETAEIVAERYGVSREAQDQYSLQSQQRTATAPAEGRHDAALATRGRLCSRTASASRKAASSPPAMLHSFRTAHRLRC